MFGTVHASARAMDMSPSSLTGRYLAAQAIALVPWKT
jgi:hypothetical protein